MSKKTVITYSEEEFEAGQSKKARSSVFIPLIFSILAAFVLWLFVIWGNNTCTGIPVQVLGNEQLLSNNYTVSSIEPANIDLVFRGKGDVIERITQDPSLVTAYVSIFGTPESDETSSYIFDSVDDIQPGEYTVSLKITAPDGVSCNEKKVKITIAQAGSKDFLTTGADLTDNGPVRLHMSNYSFANGISLDRLMVVQESVTVVGDQHKVGQIDYISLKVDWLKDLSDDATVYVTPVACDKYGDVIDSEFLRFEPATVEVNVKVSKQKILHLQPKKESGDTAEYLLSFDTVKVIGPVLEIDKLKSVLEVPVSHSAGLSEKNYVLEAADLGSNIRFVTEDGERSSVSVIVKEMQKSVTTSLSVKATDIIVVSPAPAGYVLDKTEYKVDVQYLMVDEAGSALTGQSIVAVLDLSGLVAGTHELSLKISFLPYDNVERYISVSSEKVTVTILEEEQQSDE